MELNGADSFSFSDSDIDAATAMMLLNTSIEQGILDCKHKFLYSLLKMLPLRCDSSMPALKHPTAWLHSDITLNHGL